MRIEPQDPEILSVTHSEELETIRVNWVELEERPKISRDIIHLEFSADAHTVCSKCGFLFRGNSKNQNESRHIRNISSEGSQVPIVSLFSFREVLTSDGWKKAKNIKVGDLLMLNLKKDPINEWEEE